MTTNEVSATTEKTFEVTVAPGKVVRVEHDLPFGVIADIATRHEVNWLTLIGQPFLAPAGAMLDLFKACCDHAGVEVPDPLSANMIYDSFNAVDIDLPAWYEADGTPKAARPATT